MNERFENPPLVELVAELRWKDAHTPSEFPAGFPFPVNTEAFDKQLPMITKAMVLAGYGASERLVPSGFPLPSDAPIMRYRYSGNDGDELGREHLPSTVFQLGIGVFTANAVQPYKSWNDFKHVVEVGVKILLDARKGADGGYSLSLRYIDAFRSDLSGDLSHLQFLTDVFGFKIQMPECLTKHSVEGKVGLQTMQITIPLSFGNLHLQMAEGEMENASGYILENVVVIDDIVAGNVEDIMKSFSEARSVIHDVFLNLTAPIKEKMKPLEVSQ